MTRLKISEVVVPEAPEWVKEAGPAALWAWANQYQWRCNAFAATVKSYQEFLVHEAEMDYYVY